MPELELAAGRLAWNSVGAGPPLLLVNGYAATGADWDPTFLGALGAGFEVICPDNRGVGGSEPGAGELSVASMAADMLALLDGLGLDRIVLAGWSMGGFVAQALAALAPERVAGLALISTDPGGPDAVPASAAVWARLTDHSGSPREQASRLISLLFPPQPAAAIDRDFGEVVAAARAGLSAATLRAQERAMEVWHAEPPPDLGRLDAGLAIVHGAADAVIPAANAELLAERLPGAGVEVLGECGHAVMAQQPERVAAAIAVLAG